MKSSYKIIIAGDVASGKTTAISAVSDSAPIYTEVNASDAAQIGKLFTTVAFDFTPLSLPNVKHKLQLYGLPGQVRFSLIWELLTKDALGIIVLINASVNSALEKFTTYLDQFKAALGTDSAAPMLFAVTHADCDAQTSVEQYQQIIQAKGIKAQVCSIDARQKKQVLFVINQLLEQITDQQLKASLFRT